MKVNDPNLNSLATTGASQAQGSARVRNQGSAGSASQGSGASGDDIHLSELVRSLRSLAADSPQRQQHLESIARTYAAGNYQVNASATAGKIIDDAIKP
jgi:anti-sigma28 factor (negative regulator of flagellin synthesis)